MLTFSPYTEAVFLKKIARETAKDKELKQLSKYIHKGYIPNSIRKLQKYKKFEDQITEVDGILYKQNQIILPETLWSRAIKKAHQGGHPGMNSLKRRIRSHFWFPKLNKMVEDTVKQCPGCQMHTNKANKAPLQHVPIPSKAWQDVSLDLFGPMPDKRHILVVQDIKSRYPVAKIIHSTSAQQVIPAIKDIYNDMGKPDSHRTDNGPPFNSGQFRDFSNCNGIQHRTSFPYHPQSNPVETFMKPLGKAMKIAHQEGSNKQESLKNLLTAYRSTPHPATGESPGNLLFRDGYNYDFPRKSLTEEEVLRAYEQDALSKRNRQNILNSSRHRIKSSIDIGDTVIARNFTRQRKFDPVFGPDLYQVMAQESSGFVVKRMRDGKTQRKHSDDLKLFTGQMYSDTKKSPTNWYDEWQVTENNNCSQENMEYNNTFEQFENISSSNNMPIYHNNEPFSIERGEQVAYESPQQHSHRTQNSIPRALTRLADYNNPGFSEMSFNGT